MRIWILFATSVSAIQVASGQGTYGGVTFANSLATAITNVSVGTAPPYPRFTGKIALYGSVALGLPDDSALFQVGATAVTFVPGFINAGTRYLASGGDWVTLQVRAWSGDFPNYEAAYAAAMAGDGTILLGKSPKWEQVTAADTYAEPITGTGRLRAFVVDTIPGHVPPPLNIGRTGDYAILSWSATGTNFVLEACENLSETNWTTISIDYAIVGDRCRVTNRIDSPARFFRLRPK